ncbi:MAG: CvpA family protein [Steroidobacteraceae bacterium]
MTIVDYLIIAIFLIFAIWGFIRGLFGELFSLASWVGALFLGSHFGHLVQPWFESWISTSVLQGLLACLLVGVVSFAIISIIGGLVSQKIQSSVFAPVDRMLGMLCGAARGAIIVGVLVLIGLQFGLKDRPFWKASKLAPMATTSAELLDAVVDLQGLKRQQGLVDLPVPKE